MDAAVLLTIALFVLAFGLISRALQRTWLTPPMLFVACGFILGPDVLDICDLRVGSGSITGQSYTRRLHTTT